MPKNRSTSRKYRICRKIYRSSQRLPRAAHRKAHHRCRRGDESERIGSLRSREVNSLAASAPFSRPQSSPTKRTTYRMASPTSVDERKTRTCRLQKCAKHGYPSQKRPRIEGGSNRIKKCRSQRRAQMNECLL